MLGPLPVGLLSTEEAPVFSGYDADYLVGVLDHPWTPAAPQGVGGGPATWSVSPALPTGLSIDPVTGAISGTPTSASSNVHTVSATNSGGVAQQNVTVTTHAYTSVTFASYGGATHTWKLLNGMVNAFNRVVISGGGGGGASAYGVTTAGDYSSGGGGGSSVRFMAFDWGEQPGTLPPGHELTIRLGKGGGRGRTATSTAYFNTTTRVPSLGKTLPHEIAYSSHSFEITSGPNVGKRLIYTTLNRTAIYDPVTDTFSIGPNIPFSFPTDQIAKSFEITSGAHSGKFLTIVGNTTQTALYDPDTNTFALGPNYAAASSPYVLFQITSGPNAGRTFVGTGGTDNYYYNPATHTFTLAPSNSDSALASFEIPSGTHAGKQLILLATAGLTQMFDPSTLTMSAGPTATGGFSPLAVHSVPINTGPHAGKIMVIRGVSPVTNYYDPTTHSFSNGYTASYSASTGAFSYYITSGADAGKLVMVSGATTGDMEIVDFTGPTSSVYTTILNRFCSAGAHSFPVTTGPLAGNELIIRGGNDGFVDALGFSGEDGEDSYITFQDDLYSPILVSGGSGAIGNGHLGGSSTGGSSGGPHGISGSDGILDIDLQNGEALVGGYGGAGSSLFSGPSATPQYNVSATYDPYPPSPFGNPGTGGGIYFTSPYFGVWDQVDPFLQTWGGGGGGGGVARDGSGLIIDNEAYLTCGSNGGDGFVRIDWDPAFDRTTFWADYY